jgi:beta-phosphoglucomutase
MIKGFLFDLDGVIVDTAKYHYLAWKRLADKLAIPFTEADNERLKGVSRMESLDIILSLGRLELSEAVRKDLAAKKNAWYVEFITKVTPGEILPGALEFIQQAKTQDIKIALGSASKNATTILERLDIAGYFDAVITGNEVSKAKPDPEVFLKGADALGLAPEECMVFEDAAAGVEAAINGGMKCIGIGSKENLGKANKVVAGLAQICTNDAINV